jgi:diguanylate cyclase (GGDEF)-like protein
MSKYAPDFVPAQPASLADENALLRASLEEAQRQIDALEQRGDNDRLTGLPGRRRFYEELERVVGLAERHGTASALLTIDVRGLERINRDHGRVAGDAVLVHVARSLSGLIRATDLLARTNGGGFALILDHLDMDSAIETGERISRCLAGAPVDLGGRTLPVAVAVGVTGIMAGDTLADVAARSDRNAAFAKEEG